MSTERRALYTTSTWIPGLSTLAECTLGLESNLGTLIAGVSLLRPGPVGAGALSHEREYYGGGSVVVALVPPMLHVNLGRNQANARGQLPNDNAMFT